MTVRGLGYVFCHCSWRSENQFIFLSLLSVLSTLNAHRIFLGPMGLLGLIIVSAMNS